MVKLPREANLSSPPTAELAAELAAGAAVVVEEAEPPQAAIAPAAATALDTFRKLRREIFFIRLSSNLCQAAGKLPRACLFAGQPVYSIYFVLLS